MNPLERKIQDYLDKTFSDCMEYGDYPGDYITAKAILKIVAEHLSGIQLGFYDGEG